MGPSLHRRDRGFDAEELPRGRAVREQRHPAVARDGHARARVGHAPRAELRRDLDRTEERPGRGLWAPEREVWLPSVSRSQARALSTVSKRPRLPFPFSIVTLPPG